MWALCGKGWGIWNSFKTFGDVEFSFGKWWRGMEKEICTLCVILMEDD
jgi:hypothetical protein